MSCPELNFRWHSGTFNPNFFQIFKLFTEFWNAQIWQGLAERHNNYSRFSFLQPCPKLRLVLKPSFVMKIFFIINIISSPKLGIICDFKNSDTWLQNLKRVPNTTIFYQIVFGILVDPGSKKKRIWLKSPNVVGSIKRVFSSTIFPRRTFWCVKNICI